MKEFIQNEKTAQKNNPKSKNQQDLEKDLTRKTAGDPLGMGFPQEAAQQGNWAAQRGMSAVMGNAFSNSAQQPIPQTSPVMMSAVREGENKPSNEVVHQATQGFSGGSEIPYKAEMEAIFGRSFDGVKAHMGTPQAQEACTTMGAEAYATGNSIIFKEVSPRKGLIGHELTHIIQQSQGVKLDGGVGKIGDKYEKEAVSVKENIESGKMNIDVGQEDRESKTSKNNGTLPPATAENIQLSTLSFQAWKSSQKFKHTVNVKIDPIPTLVYEKANYEGKYQVEIDHPANKGNISKVTERLLKKDSGTIQSWAGKDVIDDNDVSITTERLMKKSPKQDKGEIYAHEIEVNNSQEHRSDSTEECFEVKKYVEGTPKLVATDDKACDFENAIPFSIKGATSSIGFSTSDRMKHGFTVTKGGKSTLSTGTKISANAGMEVDGIGAVITTSAEAQKTIKNQFFNSENYLSIVKEGEDFSYDFPLLNNINVDNWLLIPVYNINTWELNVAESDENGKFLNYTPRQVHYFKHIDLWPVPSTGGTDANISKETIIMLKKGNDEDVIKQYKAFKNSENNTFNSAKENSKIEKIELTSTRQNVPNIDKKTKLPTAFTPTTITRYQSISVVNGLIFSNEEIITDSITTTVEGKIGNESIAQVSSLAENSTEIATEIANNTNSEIKSVQKIFQKFTVDASRNNPKKITLTPTANVKTYSVTLQNTGNIDSGELEGSQATVNITRIKHNPIWSIDVESL